METLKEIRDPYPVSLSGYETAELRGLASDARIRMLHLNEQEWQRFTEAFDYNANAIEGSTVTDEEVRVVLRRGKWPDRPREEIAETLGVAEAVRYVRKTKDGASILIIKELLRLVFGSSKEFAGKIRGRGAEVAVVDQSAKGVHRGAPSSQVSPLLRRLVKWYGANKDSYQPLVLAAVVHIQFETIHPFKDGNGGV